MQQVFQRMSLHEPTARTDAEVIVQWWMVCQMCLMTLDMVHDDQSLRICGCASCWFGSHIVASQSWRWVAGYKFIPTRGMLMPPEPTVTSVSRSASAASGDADV